MATRIADGVFEIDTLLGGWERVTAAYLVDGPEPVLVETGSQSSVPALLAALDDLGIAAEDLAHLVVTHIHLDHAGGAGEVAEAFPQATVHVHEEGARHLADPTRLIESAARVFGELLDGFYGRPRPVDPARISVLGDGESVQVGGERVLTAVDSPGHAKHHLALHDSASGILFVGDAIGVRLPDVGFLRPATPPPDFDLDQALHSMDRFAARRPTGLAPAHFGLFTEVEDLLDEARATLARWADVAASGRRQGREVGAVLDEAFRPELETIAPELQRRLETLNGIHSNATGLRRWLEQRREHPARPPAD